MCKKLIDIRLIKRNITDWGKVLVLLLDEAAVVLLVIVVLQFFGIRIPLLIGIVMGLVLGTFVFIIHVAVIPSFHRRIVTGSEGMLGVQGRVVEALNPVGVIIVNGERWRAVSTDDNIEADENVEIVGLEGLTLKVKRGKEIIDM
ncbi:NfeD family protein [Chloroflexota bacterium]